MYPTAILNQILWAFQGGAASGATAQQWSQSAASILIGSLWQGAVVASGLALFLRLAPRISARQRYGIWAAGFASLVCLPFMPALFARLTQNVFPAAPDHPLGIAAGSAWQSFPSHPLLALDARWSLALAALWLAASLVRGSSLVVHALRMRRLWNSASPIAVTGVNAPLPGVASRSAELCITSDLDRPSVIGFFRPRILIPAWLLNRLTPFDLDQVVLHESEHLRRNDDWANLLQKLCLVIFPLNPALWWLERRLCAEREMACDDGVVSRTQAPRAYAACLAGLAERGLEHRTAHRAAAFSLGAWQRRPELATRVHRLLRRAPVLSPAASLASAALVACGLVAGTIVLARAPQLVAFVAPTHPTSETLDASARSSQPTVQGDVNADLSQRSIAFAGPSPHPFRAVKTIAILPATRAASLARNIKATVRKGSEDQPNQSDSPGFIGHSLASLVPNEVAAQMKAQQVSPSGTQPTQTSENQSASTEPNAAQSGWLVLTTYEEIRTTGVGDRDQGDAVAGKTSANAGVESRGVNANPNANSTTSVTITRLVFRFAQPDSKVPPASNAQPASNTPPASNSTHPIAIPYRDGWLVIQL